MPECSSVSADAIKEIERLVKDGATAKTVQLPGDPKGAYVLVKPDGTTELIRSEPGFHGEKLESPDDLRQFITHLNSDKATLPGGATFVDEKQAVYVFDLNDRRNRAVVGLVESDLMRWVRVGSKETYTHKDFIRLLRIDLRGVVSGGTSMLNTIRNVKFDDAGDVRSNIQHGRESMGNSVTRQVMGADAIPEEIGITVKPFDNFSFQGEIAAAVELDLTTKRFKLTPYPDDVVALMENAIHAVAVALKARDDEPMPPVFHGSPE